jgi:hypothetical protein
MSDLRVTNLKGRNPGEAPTLPDGVVIAGITTVSSVIVGTGITLSSSGINVSGVITATSFSGNGSGLTGVSAGIGTTGSVNTSGIITATSFFGSGANLTGVAGTSVFAAGSAAAPSISPTGDSNTGIFFPAADTIAFAEGGAEAMRVDSSGRLLIGTSSANANGGILQLSSGITFPATAVAASDANTLDDYEEGTWTPTVGGTATYTKNTGNYTKLGRLVNVSFELYINTIGTGSQWQIFGLPFTVTSTGSHSAGGGVGFVNGLSTNVVSTFLRADNADTYLVLASLTAAGTFSGNNNIIGNSTRIMGSISYMT